WTTCGRWALSKRWSDEHLRLAVPDDDLRDEPWPLRRLYDRGAEGRHADRRAVGPRTARPPSAGTEPLDLAAEGRGSCGVRRGPHEGATTGEPVVAVIWNQDVEVKSFGNNAGGPRPGHGGFTAFKKKGNRKDLRGGGQLS